MSKIQHKAGPADGRPVSVDDFFAFAKKRAPGLLECQHDMIVAHRALRPGEIMRIVSLIRGDGYREQEMDSVEARCAAAYVAARIGLVDAIPVLRRAIDGDCEEPIVKNALIFALECLEMMRRSGTVPEKGRQIINLLKMRDSVIPVERRFADIVIEKADVKYGTVSSW
ncbi:MAG: hypothetical protein V1861_00825 [Candidatus Micrarchaeota archaeon]